jgi:RNA polymerase sigma-70 factor, ECF subfamily
VSLGSKEQDVDHDFYRLVSPHLVSAIHTAAAFVGKADAEDAVQEAILRAWKAWPSLRQRDSVRSWFLRITVNICHE